jgi:tRNA uridine 5-carboxymethylaminomethyl modification enzyme
MFTSRAEFRLLLRQDNADIRLSKYGKRFGLLSAAQKTKIDKKKKDIRELLAYIDAKKIDPAIFNSHFSNKSSPINNAEKVKDLVKRPEVQLKELLTIISEIKSFDESAIQEVEFNLKYEGYIRRNQELVNRFRTQENKTIPSSFDYKALKSLSKEAMEKLDKIKPGSFGQASRISGVSPADLSVLLIYLEREKYRDNVSRETSA